MRNFTQLLNNIGAQGQVGDYLILFVIICEEHFETLL